MKVYYFSDSDWETLLNTSQEKLNDILANLSAETDTRHLVVAIYILRKCHSSGGIAIVQESITSSHFSAKRGKWAFTKLFPVPENLPDRFKLIRLKFSLNPAKYPLQQIDQYGWKWDYDSFEDHFAFLFAHELHHFRRYHLGLHPREGEQSANKWALALLHKKGFCIKGERVIFRKQKKSSINKILHRLYSDRYEKYRQLTSGDSVLINYDPRGRYDKEIARVIRPLRKNARRLVIRTQDGKTWRWPIEWINLMN